MIEITRKELLEQVRSAILAAYEQQGEGRIPPPHRGQATHEAVRQRADEAAPRIFSSKADRDAHIQELAEAFDRRGADEEPGF